ncbi:putative NTE family protein [BD1-7 clade bacterium]|uniref:Putative NTE family protein n=1 Tax=BD1-7 clade bacterium TaxID=2029982 RepID=A0A5S9QX29_9GAMM|nr:putative NTE family protein [BD1-7 clade bacterium]
MTRVIDTERKPAEKTVSLVLGSGGARGLAHIGVIQCLHEMGYIIGSVSGSSIGSVIGGVYAAGKLKDFELWMRKMSRSEILSMMDFTWQKGGLVKGDKVINAMIEMVGDIHIEDLAIPYTAVAADIENHKEVWFQRGPLFEAIRASVSLPLLMTPQIINDRILIDGGVLNPVPIAPTFGDHTDIKLAVNLAGHSDLRQERAQIEQRSHENLDNKDSNPITQLLERFQKPSEQKHKFEDWGVTDVTNQAFDAMQTSIARQKLAAYPPDITIEIPRNIAKIMEFDRANELIEYGYMRAHETLDNYILT